MIRVHLPDRVEAVSSMDGALRVVATWADVPTRSVRVVLDASTDKLTAHQRKTTTHGHVWEPLAIVVEAPPAEGGVPVGATAVRIVTRDVPQDGTLFASAPQRAQVATHDGADVAIQASQQQASGAWTLIGGATFPTLGEALAKAGYKLYLLDGTIAWCAVPYLMSEEVAYRRAPKPRVGRANGKVITPVDPA